MNDGAEDCNRIGGNSLGDIFYNKFGKGRPQINIRNSNRSTFVFEVFDILLSFLGDVLRHDVNLNIFNYLVVIFSNVD